MQVSLQVSKAVCLCKIAMFIIKDDLLVHVIYVQEIDFSQFFI